METVKLIIQILFALIALGGAKVLMTWWKEIKDVKKKYVESKKDGNIDEQEEKEIAKECMEAVEASFKLLFLIKKAFKGKKVK